MEILNLFFIGKSAILIAGIIIVLVAGAIFIFRLERKIKILYQGSRKHPETNSIRKANQEFLIQGKQLDAFKRAIKLTVSVRNLMRKLSVEMNNIESLYSEFKPLKNTDFDILKELDEDLLGLINKLKNLIKSDQENLNTDHFLTLNQLQTILTESETILEEVLSSKEKTDSKKYLQSSKHIENNCQLIKELHDELIKYFQEVLTKSYK